MELATHQRIAMEELVERWEDLHDCKTGSQLARLVVPRGWGRTTVLDALEAHIAADDQRHGAVLRLPGRKAPDELFLQVAWLENLLKREDILRDTAEPSGSTGRRVLPRQGWGFWDS
jgi:hypothetical protein